MQSRKDRLLHSLTTSVPWFIIGEALQNTGDTVFHAPTPTKTTPSSGSFICCWQKLPMIQSNVEATFGAIGKENIAKLKRINAATFPVHYHANFYRDIIKQNNENLSKFAYLDKEIVGALCTRIEEAKPGQKERLYIMTLAVLAPYRGRGIGSQLIHSVLEYCQQIGIQHVALHVQVSNEDAIRFYTERFGFTKGKLVENYYQRIDPPHCYELFKDLSASGKGEDELKEPAAEGKVEEEGEEDAKLSTNVVLHETVGTEETAKTAPNPKKRQAQDSDPSNYAKRPSKRPP